MTLRLQLMLVTGVLWLMFFAPLVPAQSPQQARRPNVVFIFVDDMGYRDLGCYGNPDVKTPNIDQLAGQGARFTQFYVASPICSPSRVGVLTGQYPARHKIHSYLASRARNNSRGMAHFLDPKVETVARTFQKAGYATAHFGKWHLGGGRDVGDAPLPQNYGFDESLVSFEGLGDRVLPEGGGMKSEKLGRGKITFAPKHKLTEMYVNRSIDFIRRNKDKQFYLHLWLNDVHDAHRPSEKMLKKYEGFKANPYVQKFYAVLDEMDRQIGRLINSIDEMKLAENTLIVLTSDNGPTAWPRYEKQGYDAPGHVGELRGRKWSLYEGGIREPLIVRWKGKVPAGHVDKKSVIGAVDLFPTFCQIAKVPVPAKWNFDGTDVSAAFLGKPITRDKPLFWEYGRDENYLRPALPIDQSPNLAIRYDQWKLLMNGDGTRVELYDLNKSPREYHNVAGHHPKVTRSLIEKLLAFKKSIPGYPENKSAKLGQAKTIRLKQGQTRMSEKVPPVNNAEIIVQATITTKGKDGAIIAHGGVAAGYCVFVKNNKLSFTIRSRNKENTITGKDKLPGNEKLKIRANLGVNRVMTLRVNDKQIAKGQCSNLIHVQPVDPVNIGFDARGNVGPYEGEFRFGGVIESVSVTTQPLESFPFVGRTVTRWAGDVNPRSPLPEYPRPQLKRNQWQNLNGHWWYAIRPKLEKQPAKWDGRIVVPFPIESQLSGVQKQVGKDDVLWYRRSFTIPKAWREQNVILNFGAVDWETTVWINGKEVGSHRGGYDPFSFNVSSFLSDKEEQELVIRVWDPTNSGPQPRGKQLNNPKGIWYTPVTGIWQTVWMEPVPKTWIRSLKIIPDIDAKTVKVQVIADGMKPIEITVLDEEKKIVSAMGKSGDTITLAIPELKLWLPDSPFLYDLKVKLGEDEVASYFGMRKIETRPDDKGITRLFLNNKPLFHFGLLDQGWWPDGLYTAPTDDALKHDLEVTKKLGFNVARKHVKVEPARWYYWADKLGIMVWQDMPSAMQTEGAMKAMRIPRGAKADAELTPEAKKLFRGELKAMMDALQNHPSIVMWVPFNEGWGQHDTNEILKWVKKYDPTRLVSGPSGWEDRGYGDTKDMHKYPGPDMFPVVKGRASVLGEFGGLGLPVRGHTWVTQNNWGYRTYETSEKLNEEYEKLMRQLPGLIEKGLAAAIYTQTTDVEVEVNGVMTYDRSLIKVRPFPLLPSKK